MIFAPFLDLMATAVASTRVGTIRLHEEQSSLRAQLSESGLRTRMGVTQVSVRFQIQKFKLVASEAALPRRAQAMGCMQLQLENGTAWHGRAV